MLYAILLVPAVLATAFLLLRRRRSEPPVRVLAEAVPPPATVSGEVDPVAALDALLAELERTTVRIDGADELDGDAVLELERLAGLLEAAAEALAA
ncbi:MAG: hypothetical protein ACXVZL_10790 [Gaiellaceae bacterium]